MDHPHFDDANRASTWECRKVVGTKRPFTQKQIEAVRFFLDCEKRVRDGVPLDLAIDSKLGDSKSAMLLPDL